MIAGERLKVRVLLINGGWILGADAFCSCRVFGI